MTDVGRRRPPRREVGRDEAGLGDEESLLEDLTRLRVQLQELRQKATEFREKIRQGERENGKMDKLLQELLSKAKGGTGVSGSVLDQLREDLQALLRAKRQANEARQQLDDKESKLVTIKQIRQDLKDTKLSELEEDVYRAREEAKLKVEKLEAQGLPQHGKEAEAIYEEIVVAQNSVAEIHQKTAKLQDERVHFETMAREHAEQSSNLEEKRYLVEQQKDQCEERLQELSNVEALHRQKKETCDDLKLRLAEVKAAVRAGEAVAGGRTLPNWRLEEEILMPGFQPIQQDADARAAKLLRALRQAEGEVLSALRKEDGDQDGRLDGFELSQAMRKLGVEDAQLEATNALLAALQPGLQPSQQGSVALVDLTFGAQLQARQDPPPAPFDCSALRWAARRNGVPERDVRQRLAQCLRQAPCGSRVSVEGTKLAMQLGLNEGDATALGQHLERYQERFCHSLSSWRIRSHKSKATLLGRFVLQVAKYREVLLPMLQDDTLRLEEFMALGEKLGPSWSEEDLSEIALLLDVSPQDTEGAMALAPLVTAQRLRLALEPNGFAAQFPSAAGLCSHDLLRAIDDAAAKPGRRSLPGDHGDHHGAHHGEHHGEHLLVPPAPSEAAKSSRPGSPTKSAGDASYGDDDFHDEEEFDDDEFEDE